MTCFRQFYLAAFLIDGEMTRFFRHIVLVHHLHLGLFLFDTLLQARNQLVDRQVKFGAVFCGTRNYQRRPGLIDQNRIHLIDDGKIQLALHFVVQSKCHVVAQVIESEFIVGAIGNRALISRLLLLRALPGRDNADAQTKKFVDRAHPVRITIRKIIIHRDNMHTSPGKAIQVGR